ncbi:MAG: hypothetical protein D6732_05355 [Methanobacteriota archaeon]|nr:MAG: hypothetical protein D6732_05355 [Euryarchaeota archaeon]
MRKWHSYLIKIQNSPACGSFVAILGLGNEIALETPFPSRFMGYRFRRVEQKGATSSFSLGNGISYSIVFHLTLQVVANITGNYFYQLRDAYI